MEFEDTLRNAAELARTERIKQYHENPLRANTDPDTLDRPVLIGHCFENTRELSYEFYNRNISHKIVKGGIFWEFLEVPSLEAADALENINEEQFWLENGGIDPTIWEHIPKPNTTDEIPDQVSHYWIEIDRNETIFGNPNQDEEIWIAEIAAEARSNYGEIYIRKGHPSEHYIKTQDCYIQPWNWNPRKYAIE